MVINNYKYSCHCMQIVSRVPVMEATHDQKLKLFSSIFPCREDELYYLQLCIGKILGLALENCD